VPKSDKYGKLVKEKYYKLEEKNYIKAVTTEKGPKNPRQPIPKIKSLSPTGELTINWSKKMRKPENLAELPTSYVVVTSEAEADMVEDTGKFKIDKEERGRRLKKTRDWFETEKEYLEYLLVMDALDIELFPGDEEAPKSIEFDWDLISYDKQDIKI